MCISVSMFPSLFAGLSYVLSHQCYFFVYPLCRVLFVCMVFVLIFWVWPSPASKLWVCPFPAINTLNWSCSAWAVCIPVQTWFLLFLPHLTNPNYHFLCPCGQMKALDLRFNLLWYNIFFSPNKVLKLRLGSSINASYISWKHVNPDTNQPQIVTRK